MFPSAIRRNLPKSLDWETVTPVNGETFEGCVVGKCVEVNTHFEMNADRCCAKWVSKGELPCMLCNKFAARLCRGYLPMLTKLGEKRVILLSESVIDRALKFKMGDPVRFVRPNTGKRAMAVHLLGPYDLGADFTAKCKQLHPFDIFEYLLHLWQKPELNRYFNVEFYPSLKPVRAADEETPAA